MLKMLATILYILISIGLLIFTLGFYTATASPHGGVKTSYDMYVYIFGLLPIFSLLVYKVVSWSLGTARLGFISKYTQYIGIGILALSLLLLTVFYFAIQKEIKSAKLNKANDYKTELSQLNNNEVVLQKIKDLLFNTYLDKNEPGNEVYELAIAEAISQGKVSVNTLIEYSYDSENDSIKNTQPLFAYLLYKGVRPETRAVLLSKKPDFTHVDASGKNILAWIAFRIRSDRFGITDSPNQYSVDSFRLLLEHKVNPAMKDKDNMSSIDYLEEARVSLEENLAEAKGAEAFVGKEGVIKNYSERLRIINEILKLLKI